MLVIVFGTSNQAVSTVLGAYMAGLAIGGIIFGIFSDKIKKPFFLYGAIELCISIIAIIIPILFSLAKNLYVIVHQIFSPEYAFFSFFRFLLSFFILLPATTLIGASVPVAVSAVARYDYKIGEKTGIIYGLNTVGSIIGAFLCGFLFLRIIPMSQVNIIAGFLNFLIGITAIVYSAKTISLQKPQILKEKPEYNFFHFIVLLSYFFSGFAALGYENLWTRALSFILGNRIYAFSTILCVFLFGMAIGSIVFSRFVDKIKKHLFLFGFFQFGIGFFAIISIQIINILPFIQDYFYQRLKPGWGSYLFVKFLITTIPIFLPTFFMGASFPLITKIFIGRNSKEGTGVGYINASNTIGAIFGSIFTGFIIIPILGIAKSTIFLAIINFIISITFLFYEFKNNIFRAVVKISPIILIAFLTIFLFPHEFALGKYKKYWQNIFYEEGSTATVSVFYNSKTKEKLLEINGVNEVPTDYAAMRTFKLLGHLPLLLLENPKDILMITFGGGIAAGSAAFYPINKLDCVEICSSVINAAKKCMYQENNNVLQSPILKMHIEDGRNFLLTSKKLYDAIISDATHPTSMDSWVLYTKEFYVLCKAHLTDGGIFAQWLPLHNISAQEYKTITSTFCSVFSNSYLLLVAWNSKGGHSIIIGSKNKIDTTVISLKINENVIHEDLSRYGFSSPQQILQLFVLDSKGLKCFYSDAKINTDDFSFLSVPQQPFVFEPVEKKIYEIIRARNYLFHTMH